mgnify:CR=1 FL=1
MEKIRLTEPVGTETRISRCTDQQVLPVEIHIIFTYLNFSAVAVAVYGGFPR